MIPGPNDGIAECAFCIGAGQDRLSNEAQFGGVVDVVAGFVRFESGGEFVGVVEDFSGGRRSSLADVARGDPAASVWVAFE